MSIEHFGASTEAVAKYKKMMAKSETPAHEEPAPEGHYHNPQTTCKHCGQDLPASTERWEKEFGYRGQQQGRGENFDSGMTQVHHAVEFQYRHRKPQGEDELYRPAYGDTGWRSE